MSSTGRYLLTLLLLASTVLVVGCQADATSTPVVLISPATAAPAAPTATLAALVSASPTAEPTVTPRPPAATPTPEEALVEPSPQDTAPAEATAEKKTLQVTVYFSRVKENELEVVPVARTIPYTLAVGRTAINELLKGPTPAEKELGLSSPIPEGTRLLSLKIVAAVAYADFDKQLDFQVGGSARVQSIRDVIARTLKQFPTVQDVVISVEGRTEGILQP